MSKEINFIATKSTKERIEELKAIEDWLKKQLKYVKIEIAILKEEEDD